MCSGLVDFWGRNAKETCVLAQKISAAKDLLQRQNLSHRGSTIPAGTTEALKSSSEPTRGSITQPTAENNSNLPRQLERLVSMVRNVVQYKGLKLKE